jgi:bifunctional hydroxylase/dehydrase
VILAGDAAHVHLPAGGQGLSTGVQDAANLGWKLAATVRGGAPDGLLDSYHAERHTVGKRLLMNTKAQGMLFVGGPDMDPMRALFAELIAYDDVRRHLAGVVSGLDIRYDVGPGDHPLLGRRLPPRPLRGAADARSTTELLHAGRGVLLDLADEVAARDTALRWSDRVTVVSAALDPKYAEPLADTRALLVRPDGYVVWADPDGGDLPTALTRWFGAPAT